MKAAKYLAVGVVGMALSVGWAAESGATSAPATGPGARAGMMPGGPMAQKLRAALADLNLTDEQKEKIKAIVMPQRQQLQAWRSAHQDQLQKLRQDLQAARADKDRQKAQAAAQSARQMMQDRPMPKEALEKIKEVLTPEQWEKLQTKIGTLKENLNARLGARAGGAGKKGAAPAATEAK